MYATVLRRRSRVAAYKRRWDRNATEG